MEEPSVLDYLKAKLNPWRKAEELLPEETGETQIPERKPGKEPGAGEPEARQKGVEMPWRTLAALLLALAGQMALEPGDRSVSAAVSLFILAGALLGWAFWRGEWRLAKMPEDVHEANDNGSVRNRELMIGALLSVIAFLLFNDNRFNFLNFYLWLCGILLIGRAFWLDSANKSGWWQRLGDWLRRPQWEIKFDRWTLAWLGVFALGAWFRFYRLADVPPEMVSDHAEKLWDVFEVLDGQTRIFFPRNTGREAYQMYLTAAVIEFFKTGFTFLSLKIGTAGMGVLTLPYIYLLGKELANKRVGLLAMAFAGIAYWPNVIARVALRFILYPFFTAPVLYHLVRGLKRQSRNDFILAGIWLGAGLHGYSTMRIVPFVVVALVLIFLLHRQAQGVRKQTVIYLALLAVMSAIVFLPLMRYALENPDMFSYRAMTRLGSVERELPGPAWLIFLQNTWNSLRMMNWDNGNIWVHSLPGRPALDYISAALLLIGAASVLVRYLRQRHWVDLALLLSVPLLMLPSILSLAFPDENPSLNRSGAAMIPVFLLVGYAVDGIWKAVARQKTMPWRAAAAGLVVLLLGWASLNNYDLVFVQYYNQYRASAWNTSEMGAVVEDFSDSFGSIDQSWVLAYPHWVDTRLVALNAGYPMTDLAINVDQLVETQNLPGSKLFLVNPRHQEALVELGRLYPQGAARYMPGALEGKDYYLYIVLDAAAGADSLPEPGGSPGGGISPLPTAVVPEEPVSTP